MPGTPMVLSDGPQHLGRVVKMRVTRGITDEWEGTGTWDPAIWWDRHKDLKPQRDCVIKYLQAIHHGFDEHHPKKIHLAGSASLRLRLMCAVRIDSNVNIRQIVGHLGAIDWYLDTAHMLCTEEMLKAVKHPAWTPLALPVGHELGIDGLYPSMYEDVSVDFKLPDGLFKDPIDKSLMRKYSCLETPRFFNDAVRVNVGANDYGQFEYLELPDSPQDQLHQMMDILRTQGRCLTEGFDAALEIREHENRLYGDTSPDGLEEETTEQGADQLNMGVD